MTFLNISVVGTIVDAAIDKIKVLQKEYVKWVKLILTGEQQDSMWLGKLTSFDFESERYAELPYFRIGLEDFDYEFMG